MECFRLQTTTIINQMVEFDGVRMLQLWAHLIVTRGPCTLFFILSFMSVTMFLAISLSSPQNNHIVVIIASFTLHKLQIKIPHKNI